MTTPDLSRFHRLSLRTMGGKVRLRFSMIRGPTEHDPVCEEIACKNLYEAMTVAMEWYEAKNGKGAKAGTAVSKQGLGRVLVG